MGEGSPGVDRRPDFAGFENDLGRQWPAIKAGDGLAWPPLPRNLPSERTSAS